MVFGSGTTRTPLKILHSQISIELSRIPPSLQKAMGMFMRESFGSITTYLSTGITSLWHCSTRVFDHPRWRASGICSIHVPSLAISVTLLFLNFSTAYYEDVGLPGQNLHFNALQFAAKCHEILIAASLSTVIANYMQYELSRSRGLSLESVLAGLQITNLSSLWSHGLWSGCFTHGFKAYRGQFILLVIVLAILATTVGPSSAILILPSIGWWNSPYSLDPDALWPDTVTDSSKALFFFAAPESALWPTRVTVADFSPPPDCNFTSPFIPEHCPAGGLPLILSQPGLTRMFINLTMPVTVSAGAVGSVGESFLEETEMGDWPPGSLPVALAASRSITASIGNMLNTVEGTSNQFSNRYSEDSGHYKYEISFLNGTQLPAPKTLSLCAANLIEVMNGSIWSQDVSGVQLSFPIDLRHHWSQDLPLPNWTISADPLLQLWNESNPSAAIWIEPPYLGNNTPSIAAAFVAVDDFAATTIEFVTCSLYATWQPTVAYTDPTFDSSIHTTFTDDHAYGKYSDWDMDFNNGTEDKNFDDGTAIQLDVDWAGLALPMNHIVQQMPNYFALDFDSGSKKLSLATFLSLLITDAMARIAMDTSTFIAVGQGNGTMMFTFNDTNATYLGSYGFDPPIGATEEDMKNMTEIAVIVLRYGYSYSVRGITRQLAAGILLFHLVVVLIHTMLVVGFARKGPVVKSLFDIVIIAFNSRPTSPSPADSSPRDKISEDYKSSIQLREGADSQVEFVLIDGKHG